MNNIETEQYWIQKTIKDLADRNIKADRATHHNGRTAADLFGILDIVGIDHRRVVYGVQVTSYGNLSSHKSKMLASEWLERLDHWEIEIYAYRKNMKRMRYEWQIWWLNAAYEWMKIKDFHER